MLVFRIYPKNNAATILYVRSHAHLTFSLRGTSVYTYTDAVSNKQLVEQ